MLWQGTQTTVCKKAQSHHKARREVAEGGSASQDRSRKGPKDRDAELDPKKGKSKSKLHQAAVFESKYTKAWPHPVVRTSEK